MKPNRIFSFIRIQFNSYLFHFGLGLKPLYYYSSIPKNRTKSAERTIFGPKGRKMKQLLPKKNFGESLQLALRAKQLRAFQGKRGKKLARAFYFIISHLKRKKKPKKSRASLLKSKSKRKFVNRKDLFKQMETIKLEKEEVVQKERFDYLVNKHANPPAFTKLATSTSKIIRKAGKYFFFNK